MRVCQLLQQDLNSVLSFYHLSCFEALTMVVITKTKLEGCGRVSEACVYLYHMSQSLTKPWINSRDLWRILRWCWIRGLGSRWIFENVKKCQGMKIDFSASGQAPANEEEGIKVYFFLLLKDGWDKCWGWEINVSTYINCCSSNKRHQVLNRCDFTSLPCGKHVAMTWQVCALCLCVFFFSSWLCM